MAAALLSPYKFGEKTVANRFTAQAMEINAAGDGGEVSDRIIERYKTLAKGEWGIVFSEAIGINTNAVARKHGLVINKNTKDGFKDLVKTFKNENSDSLFLFQITHPGRNNVESQNRIKVYEDDEADIPVASIDELNLIREQFIDSAAFAVEAGADGIDIKACHGYLGAEFFRPLNNRNDCYGGSRENRARFIASIVSDIKKKFPNLIVGSRISIYEGIRGGCGVSSPDEVVEDLYDILEIMKIIVNSGADFLNVSAGIPVKTPMLTRPVKNANHLMYHHFRYQKIIKQMFPQTAVIGSAYSTGKMESILYGDENLIKGYVDLVGFGRQNLADPLMPSKFKKGESEIKWCTLCGGCSTLLKNQQQVYCSYHDKSQQE